MTNKELVSLVKKELKNKEVRVTFSITPAPFEYKVKSIKSVRNSVILTCIDGSGNIFDVDQNKGMIHIR